MNPADPYGLLGQVLDGQFRVDAYVGDGNLSVVYKGKHVGLDEDIALKCLKLPPAINSALVESFVQRFREESRILYRLSQGNLHICRCLASGTTMAPATGALVPYMVLEWLEGRSLDAELKERRARGDAGRSLDDALKALDGAAEAVAYAHAQGVVHRDLNPSNLFLATTRDGVRLKVLDFGLAKLVSGPATPLTPRHQGTIGHLRLFSPAYGAPEQFDERVGPVGPWTDVYSFALVALEWVRGRRVMDGEHFGELAAKATDRGNRPTPRKLGLTVSDEVEATFARAFAVAPQERPQDVGELWGALKNAMRREAEVYPRVSSPGPGPRPGSTTLAFGDLPRGALAAAARGTGTPAAPPVASGTAAKPAAGGIGGAPRASTAGGTSPLAAPLRPGPAGGLAASAPVGAPAPARTGSAPTLVDAPSPKAPTVGSPRPPVAAPVAAPRAGAADATGGSEDAAGAGPAGTGPAGAPAVVRPAAGRGVASPLAFGKTMAMSGPPGTAGGLPSPGAQSPAPALAGPSRIGSGTLRLDDVKMLADVARARDAATTKITVPAELLESSRPPAGEERPTSVDPLPPTLADMEALRRDSSMPPPHPTTLQPSGLVPPPPAFAGGPSYGAPELADGSSGGDGASPRGSAPPAAPLGSAPPAFGSAPPAFGSAPPAYGGSPMPLGDTIRSVEGAPYLPPGVGGELPFAPTDPRPGSGAPIAAGFGPGEPLAPATQGMPMAAPAPNWSGASAAQETTHRRKKPSPLRPLLFAALGAACVLGVVGIGYVGYRAFLGRNEVTPAASASAEPGAAAHTAESAPEGPATAVPAEPVRAAEPAVSAEPARAEPARAEAVAATAAEPTPAPPSERTTEREPDSRTPRNEGSRDPATPRTGATSAGATSAGATSAGATSAGSTEVSSAKAFSPTAAKKSLDVINHILASCKRKGGVTGPGRINVTFSPDGSVSSAVIDKAPYEGTSEASCISSRFKLAKMQPFEGPPGTLEYTFSVPK